MITIHIHNIDTCYEAIEWCASNLPLESWKLDNFTWPAAGLNFSFTDTNRAVLFSLKWLNS